MTDWKYFVLAALIMAAGPAIFALAVLVSVCLTR